MKSLQIQDQPPKTQARYSELRVCRSSVGWFIGSTYRDTSDLDRGEEPGTRDTDYFASVADATFALQMLERMHAEHMRQRNKRPNDPELTDEDFSADFAAVLVVCGLDPRGVGLRLEP